MVFNTDKVWFSNVDTFLYRQKVVTTMYSLSDQLFIYLHSNRNGKQPYIWCITFKIGMLSFSDVRFQFIIPVFSCQIPVCGCKSIWFITFQIGFLSFKFLFSDSSLWPYIWFITFQIVSLKRISHSFSGDDIKVKSLSYKRDRPRSWREDKLNGNTISKLFKSFDSPSIKFQNIIVHILLSNFKI